MLDWLSGAPQQRISLITGEGEFEYWVVDSEEGGHAFDNSAYIGALSSKTPVDPTICIYFSIPHRKQNDKESKPKSMRIQNGPMSQPNLSPYT